MRVFSSFQGAAGHTDPRAAAAAAAAPGGAQEAARQGRRGFAAVLAPSPLDRPQDAQCRLRACGRQGARRHGGCPQGQCAWPRICSVSRAGLPLPGFLRSAPQAAVPSAAAGDGSESEPLHDAVRHRPPRRQPRQEPSGVQDAVLHGPGQAPRPARQASSPAARGALALDVAGRRRVLHGKLAPPPSPPRRPRHGQGALSHGQVQGRDRGCAPSGPGTGREPSPLPPHGARSAARERLRQAPCAGHQDRGGQGRGPARRVLPSGRL